MALTSGRVCGAYQRAVRLFDRLFPRFDPAERTPLPTRPRSRDEVPAAAWSALEAACGDLVLERMLVIPTTTRNTWRGPQLVIRTRVAAFGTEAVGQWTDDGGAGAIECIPVADILAIDDRVVLLHGRLALVGKRTRLEIQYNAVARPQLRESILWLRRLIAGPEFATRPSFVWVGSSGDGRPAGELPYKWAYLLAQRADLRIDPSENEMVAVGDVVEGARYRARPATGLAVLGPRELVVAAEPQVQARSPRYGVDLTVVPRAHIRDVGWSRGNLQIRLRAGEDARPADGPGTGATDEPALSRPLDGRLFEAMRRSFGDAVDWASPDALSGRRPRQ